jgi:hypothetical protein
MHYTIRLIAQIWLNYLLGHVSMELELEVLAEQAQVKAITNLALDQGKPHCIQPILLVFYIKTCFML